MPNFNFDFLKSYNNDLGSFRYVGNGPTTLLAYYDNNSGHDVNSLYGITDWFADMRRDMYRRTQEGEMDESQDRMASSKQAIDLSLALLDDFKTMDSNAKDEDKAIAREQALQNLELLRKNGFWSQSLDPTKEDLDNIIADSQSRYDKELKNYLHNLDQYNESMAAYDISQYYTRKSNEAVTNFSNFFYKLPSVMGTSNTSPGWQTASMASGWVGAKVGAWAGAKIGAAIGSVIPGAGTGAGAGIGSLIGTVAGAVGAAQGGGGIQARQNESHMEAFNGYFEGTIRQATKEGVDLGKVADNVRRQLDAKGVNTEYMDQNQLLEAALSMTDIVTGSAAFDRIASDQFLGTRRIYEQNNALGAGEAIADLSYVLPVGRFVKQGFSTIGKAAFKTTDKMLFGNRITNALTKRFSAGLDVAKFGSALRNRAIWDKMSNFVTGAALRSAIEGSEEGAQHIIVENYLNGEYDDEYANSTFMDAVDDGQLLSDLYDNVALRAKSLGAVFNVGQYKNDKQMLEEIMMGALLPFTSPQAMVGASFNAKATYDQIFKSKRIGDYLASAYAEQDDINRTQSLYKLIREGVGSSSNYETVLENARKMLLSADPKTGKINGNIDSTVLTDDNSVPQEADINKFIDQQYAAYQRLKNIKKASNKQLKSLKLDPEDEDLFLALKSNAIAENSAAELGLLLANDTHMRTVQKIAQDKNFREYVEKLGFGNESEYAAVAQIVMLNEEIDHVRNLIDNVDAFANLTKAMKQSGMVGSQAFLSAADSAAAYGNILNSLIAARDEAMNYEGVEWDILTNQNMLKNMYMPTTNVELYTEVVKNANTTANTMALHNMVTTLNKGFNTTDKAKALDYVNKYKEARKANDQIADSTNEALREKQDPAQQTAVAETKVDDYTTEALEQKRQEDQQLMTDAVSKFKELLDAIPQDSYVHSLVEQINSRALPFVDDDTSYARNVSRTVKRLLKQYEAGLKDSKVSDEDKTRLNNLLEAADNLGKRFDDLLKLNTELKARAERHKFVIPSNSTVWFDEAGNRYQLDMGKAEYSENEGLILHLKPVSEDTDPSIDERINKLQAVRDKLETNREKADDELKKKLDAIIPSMDSMINNLKQMKEDESKREIIMHADDPFLNSLTSKDNEGKDIFLSKEIQTYVNKVNKNIEQNKADRLKSIAQDAVDGDVFIFDINDAKTNRTNAPKYKEDYIEGSNGKMSRATGYALNTTFGAKQASKLLNPYFAAKYWHGFITMRYVDEAHAKKYFYDKDKKEDYGIVDRKGEHYDRYAAIKLFHKIGEKIATGNLKDSDIYEPLEKLAKNEAKDVKVAGIKVTKKEYDNMIGALPLTAFMYQQHTGKQVTTVVLADFASRNRQTTPSNEEYNGRVDLINNLLINYKEINKKEVKDEELAGLKQEEAEREFGNRVYFSGPTGVTLSYSDFDYNTRTKRNEALNIFTDDAGNQMSTSEINKLYQDRLPDAINQFSNHIDDFIQLLTDLGYKITKEELLAAKDGESILSQLLLNTIKYGDGVIDYKGTYQDRLTSLLGTVTGGKTNIKGRALERAKKILQFTWDKIPEAFISFKNRQDEERRTPSVTQSVEEALRSRYFNGKNAIQITQNGEKIDVTDSDENRAKITKMFQQFEKALRDNKSVTDFMQSLFDAGYSFELDGSKEKANAVIRDYFFNRHFSRLRTPSNIVQAFTLGKSTPLNDAVDYENFGRTVEHVQAGISEVKALGLVKGENGKYYFSIDKWYDKNVKTKSDEDSGETEYEALVRETNEQYEQQVAAISKMKSDELLKYIEDNRDSLPSDDLLKQNRKGETVLKHKVPYTRQTIKDALEKQNTETLSSLKEKYEKDATDEIKKTDEFDGLKTTPITFAYGSYETDSSGASIVYRDKDGNKHNVSNATGTPGALYMIMPSFLSSARRSVPVKLNPKRFDRPMAVFIAQLLDYVRKGAKIDDFLTTNTIGDFNVSTNVSIRTLLDSLIFTGKDAIRNNPSDRNYASLLYIDNDNSVHFGGEDNVLTDDNLEDLVKFIMDNKTYRIDRDKATNHNATFGIDLSIKSNKDSEFGEQDLLDVKSEDNYIAYLIDNKWLLTDLNTSQESNLFTGPRVHIDYRRKRTFIGIPNDSKSKGSAANARAKLEEEEMATKEEVEVDMEENEVDFTLLIAYTKKFINGFLDTVTKHIADGTVSADGIKIAYYGLKSNKIFDTYPTRLSLDNDSNSPNYGSQQLIVEPGKSKDFQNEIAKLINKKAKFALALVDADGNLIEVNGEPVMAKPAFKGKVSASKKESKSTKSNDEGGSLREEFNRLNTNLERLLSGGYSAPAASPAAPAQPARVPVNTGAPSGYTPLSAPAAPETPTGAPISFADDLDTDAPKVTINGDTVTVDYNSGTFEWKKGDDINTVLDNADEAGVLTDTHVEEVIRNVYDSINWDSKPSTSGTGVGWGTVPTPASKFVGTESKSKTAKPTAKPAAKPAPTLTLPDWSDVLEFATKNDEAKKILDNINNLRLRNAEAREFQSPAHVQALIRKYLRSKYPTIGDKNIDNFINSHRTDINRIANRVAIGEEPSAKLGSVLSFINEHVQKEDFHAALSRTEKILGKNFNLSILPTVEKAYDKSRGAMVYVFGQCASSGIRLFRDADNRIAKGSMYHEAFHKISLFTLDASQREQMYNDARDMYDEILLASDLEVEEFLADRFAEFVLDAELRQQGKYYSSNPVYKFFQKMFDFIRNIINRLTSANITPEYVNMNKLFEDMYSGRYAYAKATKNNIELFDKIYAGYTPYLGFKVNDVEIANDAMLYQDIFRDILGRFIRTSNLLTVKAGNIEVDMNSIRNQMVSELAAYGLALDTLQRRMTLSKNNPTISMYSAQDMDVAACQMMSLISVYNMVLQPDVWKEWSKIIKDFVRINFNLQRIDSEDPNQVLNTDLNDEGEPISNAETLQISNKRDSYLTNMFDSSDISMKMLLWSVSQFDPTDPTTGKFTPDGMLQYSNVRQVFRDTIHAIRGSKSIQDMLDKLNLAADRAIKQNGDYSLKQLHGILTNPDTNPAIVNRFFTDFVRYVHNFENHTYQNTSNNPDLPKYDASVRSGNIDRIQESLLNRWKQSTIIAIDNIAASLPKGTSREDNRARVTAWATIKKKVTNAVNAINPNNLKTIEDALLVLNSTYGFGISDNVHDDALIVQSLYRDARSRSLLPNVVAMISNLQSSDFYSKSDKTKSGAQKKLEELFGEKGLLTTLAEKMGSDKRPSPKTDSMRGPGGTKIYSIGAYNFITRFFNVLAKDDKWLNKLSLNPYAMHSRWLMQLKRDKDTDNIKIHTKLATILDDNYNEGVADIDITEKEDMMNRFVSIMTGKHPIPSLANKRFAADISGIEFIPNAVDASGNINSKVIDTFVGYLADEILAVSDALYTRRYFIANLNKITGKSFTYKSFSKLTSIEQEELFKNNPEAARLLRLLVSTYHYRPNEDLQQYVVNSNGVPMLRSFHIDLTKGMGYKFRHFKNIGSNINLTTSMVDSMSKKNVFTDHSRLLDSNEAYNIANEYRKDIENMLRSNIAALTERYIELGLISGFEPNVANGSVDIDSLNNNFLPENVIDKKGSKPTGQELYNALALVTLQGMSDTIEFEKLVSGDIGYHKNITSVNKRYSGITSTIQATSDVSTIQNAFKDDRLFNSPTFNSITVNTTKVFNVYKFNGDLSRVLGENVVTGWEVSDDKSDVKPTIDHTKLLDAEGNFTQKAQAAPLVKRYIKFRDQGIKTGSNDELAKQIVNDAINRYRGYLSTDPTDAAVYITAEMYRQLRQREGKWNVRDEAMYDLLENYDRIIELSETHPTQLQEMAKNLGISYDTLLNKAKEGGEEYKGWVINITSDLQATSLKYIYYGDIDGMDDHLIRPTYDKQSYVPMFKIFCDEHQMKDVYNFMMENGIDLLKFESAVKSGASPNMEVFDSEGNIDTKALSASVVTQQYFDLVGKQLNTDAHQMHQTALLTQFMKIAMTNIQKDVSYNLNGHKISGKQMLETYRKILDHFTEKGLRKFSEKFGITTNGIDKTKLMNKLQSIAASQNIPADTLNAFSVDADGNFIINPAGIPNARWLESSILSEMGKTIIDTLTPGQALYQASSFGFDNIFRSKHHPDTHLLMPGEIKDDGTVNNRMQVKLSILFFKDILDKAKAEAKAGRLKGYDFDNFYDQRRFILENQELFALSYRVPTQGQNSTLPVEIVDLFPPQRGAIISFPASITTLTGSDFDIDKMFLARPNYEIWNGKMRKVGYAVDAIINGDLSKHSDESLQNMLLDMYQAVLMNREHALASDTPLDVCTAPVRNAISENDKLMNQKMNSYDGNLDGFWANPIFQTMLKVKNSGSDAGIGPMALNNTFRFHIQASGLKLRSNEYLKLLGIDNIDRIYDRHGEDILDITEALINAFVDAVKDNFIGRANVNPYTFDIASFLITAGFGNDVFTFLSQPILRDLAEANLDFKSGKLAIAESDRKGDAYVNKVKDKWSSLTDVNDDTSKLASVKEMSVATMKKNLDGHDAAQQLRYLNTFMYLKDLAQDYRDAITAAQIDTKKYGISADDIIAFIQGKEQFASPYNSTFSNPEVLFDNTFLGKKFEDGVMRIFDVFSDVILEFSDFYKSTADALCRQYGVFGRNSKRFLKRVGPRIKAVAFSRFFNEYLVNRYSGSSKPLYDLVSGSNSVPARYNQIMQKAIMNNEGVSFFQWVKYNPIMDSNNPQFFVIDRSINDDAFIKSNVQASISELFNSEDADVRQWITDFAVYMFYLTGANDTNAGGLIKTTLYDILPPQHLANIKLANGLTFNQYIQNYVMNRDSAMSQPEMDQVMRLVALSDDTIVKTIRPGKDYFVNQIIGKDVITVTKGSYRLRSDNGMFDKFIKVQVGNSSPITYRLGDITIVKGKNGKTYTNPIYYREQSLGYRNMSRAAFSVRVDGYIDADGNIASLLNQNDKSKVSSIRNLDEKEFNKVTKSIYGLQTLMDANSLTDMSTFLDGNFNIPEAMQEYLDYVLIDASDTVYYLNNNEQPVPFSIKNLKNYAEYKGKHFVVVSDLSEEIEKAQGTATIIGTVSNGFVEKVVEANPGTTFNARFIDRAKPNDVNDRLATLIETGHAKGRVAGIQNTDELKSSTTAKPNAASSVFNSMNTNDTSKNVGSYRSTTEPTLHSGGANGSDSIWDDLGKPYGVKPNHYYHGKPTPRGNIKITEEEFERGKQHVLKANETLHREPNKYMDLLARNWIQVENADAVVAIGKFKNGVVSGGTGWAVQMAIDANKPLYIFNQDREKWYTYSNGFWSEITTPTLPLNFAGIGTREINNAGIQAIRDVYSKTFGSAKTVKGENISSRGSEFARRLTNPGNSEAVEYKGTMFRNAEHAYLTWKSGEFDFSAYRSTSFKPVGTKKVNKNESQRIMTEIIKAKLQQHPDLVQGIDERGGINYLNASTHSVTGDVYWEGKDGGFMKALKDAYLEVKNDQQDSLEAKRKAGLETKKECKGK